MKRPPIVILAGGKGTRLGELTRDTPKPMVDVSGKPFLYWLIKYYTSQGFTEFHISTGYKAEVIENYPWSVPVEFHRDNDQNGPDSALARIGVFNPWAWVCNGDTWPLTVLPDDTDYPYIGSYCDIDAGVQLIGHSFGVSRIKSFRCPFMDIGTPHGLESFTRYFKNHWLQRQD